jgi:phage baseplate assembly protein W
MNATTGHNLDDMAHLRQSIGDILTTPLGSRVMRRDYGATIFPLLDQPDNATNRLRLYAATADALARWEPRIAITRISMEITADGRAEIDLEGAYQPNGTPTGELLVISGVPLQ